MKKKIPRIIGKGGGWHIAYIKEIPVSYFSKYSRRNSTVA